MALQPPTITQTRQSPPFEIFRQAQDRKLGIENIRSQIALRQAQAGQAQRGPNKRTGKRVIKGKKTWWIVDPYEGTYIDTKIPISKPFNINELFLGGIGDTDLSDKSAPEIPQPKKSFLEQIWEQVKGKSEPTTPPKATSPIQEPESLKAKIEQSIGHATPSTATMPGVPFHPALDPSIATRQIQLPQVDIAQGQREGKKKTKKDKFIRVQAPDGRIGTMSELEFESRWKKQGWIRIK